MARRVANERPPWPAGIVPAVLALRLATEVALLAALAWAAAALVLRAPLKILLAVLAAVAGAAVWGTWVAPASARRLHDPARLGVELALFAAGAGALAAVDDAPAAAALAVAGAGLAVAVRLLPPGASSPNRQAERENDDEREHGRSGRSGDQQPPSSDPSTLPRSASGQMRASDAVLGRRARRRP